jgi:hypothetical protein
MRLASVTLLVSAALAGGCNRPAATAPSIGPSGGDLVPVKGGTAYAELLANADTGEVMVHTWDKDLRTRRPVEMEPIRVGAGEKSAELMPHPSDGDPPGKSSRFYGHADWMRGGTVRHGWLAMSGEGGERHTFDWQGCWQGGKAHGRMWEEMGEHRHMGRGPGHRGGPNER